MANDKYWFINHNSYLNIVEDNGNALVSPTEVKTVRIHLKALYPQITAVDGNTTLLPIEHEDTLLEGMKAELFEMTGDMKSALVYKQTFAQMLKDLVAEVARGKKTNHTMINYDL